jgi:hypothetical protein
MPAPRFAHVPLSHAEDWHCEPSVHGLPLASSALQVPVVESHVEVVWQPEGSLAQELPSARRGVHVFDAPVKGQ